MADMNLSDFYGRIARIETARAKGYGFEAEGTLGRSYYFRPSRKRRSILGPMLIVLACGFGLKGAIHYKVGADTFDRRVESMMASDGFSRFGAYLMQSDPVTLYVSSRLQTFLK